MSPSARSTQSFIRQFRHAVLLPSILMGLLALVLLFLATELIVTAHQGARIDRITSKIERIEAFAVRMESHARGFLLTEDARFLNAFQNAEQRLPEEFDALRADIQESPEIEPGLIRLADEYQNWRSVIDQMIQLKQNQNPAYASASLQVAGMTRMDALQTEAERLTRMETQRRIALEQRSEKTVRWSIGAALAILLGFALLFVRVTRRQIIRISGQYRAALDHANEKAQLAENSLKTRDDFLSVASHELNTPLTHLRLRLHLLGRTLNSSPLTPPQRSNYERGLRAMEIQVDRLARLNQDLLDVTRISAGKMHFRFEAVSLGTIMREVLDSLQSEMEASGCRIDVIYESDASGQWDRSRIDRVLASLLSNAMKYAPHTQIRVRIRAIEGRARIIVEDSGIGIDRKDLPRIFDLFGRASSSQNYGGLGIGLYIARQIVEAHGGGIRVESVPGRGSVFIVDLPIEQGKTAMEPWAA